MTWIDRTAGAALAVASLAGVAWLSRAPVTAHRSDEAVLRLAWSALPERIEECRERTPEELAQLPQHMRQPVVCEGTTATYRLQVRFERVEEVRAGDAPAPAPAARRGEHVPPTLRLERRLQFSPREVILVTYAPEAAEIRGRDNFQLLPTDGGRN
jgi:hypothetical protein